MDVILEADERLDDLQNGYKLIQNVQDFCYGMDAVLLSWFTRVRKGERALDLCTGSGVIPILLKAKTEGVHFTGLELQERSAAVARKSVAYNDLGNVVSIVTGDVREAVSIFGAASFPVVTCNPPYMTENHGLTNTAPAKAIARH